MLRGLPQDIATIHSTHTSNRISSDNCSDVLFSSPSLRLLDPSCIWRTGNCMSLAFQLTSLRTHVSNNRVTIGSFGFWCRELQRYVSYFTQSRKKSQWRGEGGSPVCSWRDDRYGIIMWLYTEGKRIFFCRNNCNLSSVSTCNSQTIYFVVCIEEQPYAYEDKACFSCQRQSYLFAVSFNVETGEHSVWILSFE